MTPLNRPQIIGFAIAALTFAADQLVKWVMLAPLHLREVGQITLLPMFNFTFTENTGVSLGLLHAGSDLQRWLLVALTALIALVVLVWLTRERRLGDTVALGLVLGGALGNIRDRAALGYVLDYADLHFGEFRPFLIFNLADAAISIGVLIILARSALDGHDASTWSMIKRWIAGRLFTTINPIAADKIQSHLDEINEDR